MNDFQNIPADLRASSSWLVWKLGPLNPKTGRHPKLPCNYATGDVTDKADPSVWISFEEAISKAGKFSGIGLLPMGKVIGFDLDKCRDKETGEINTWAKDWIARLNSYTEISPSGDGLHVWFLGEAPQKGVARKDGAEVYAHGKQYLTITGEHLEGTPPSLRTFSKAETAEVFERVRQGKSVKTPAASTSMPALQKLQRLLDGDISAANTTDYSAAVHSCLTLLAIETICDREQMEQRFKDSVLCKNWKESDGRKGKWNRLRETEIEKACVNAREHLKKRQHKKAEVIDPDSWRDGYKSKTQLTTEEPQFLIDKLIPEGALTFITAGSYNCKTWLAMAAMKAISTSEPLWCFNGPQKPIPVRYHVPEMGEALVRQRMDALGIDDSEMFLVRTMEAGVWPLDDPRMLRSAEGCAMFYDTAGYFNPGDDSASYKQAIDFALLVYRLLNAGARAVICNSHPPKYSRLPNGKSGEAVWTLENSILGSAGYGGILRSCLRMANLNPDLNDPNVWVYVQGLKNPGLKPFQLQGPLPLKMKVPPGESPYLSELLKAGKGDLQARVWERYQVVKSYRKVAEEFGKSKSYIENLVKAQEKQIEPHQQQAELNIEEDDHGM